MAKNYKEDFDYSEAIANTQDAGKRQELLAERQNKIDTEGLAGKVASNEAVSTWNGNYRPYSVSSGSSGGGGGASAGASALNRLYEAAEQARLKRPAWRRPISTRGNPYSPTKKSWPRSA